MGKFVAGQVVVVPFPFSDLKQSKRRPALVLAEVERDNLILCQITSRAYAGKRAIKITKQNFETGSLPVISFIRPDKLFTAEPSLILDVVGELSQESMSQVLSQLRGLFG